MFSSTLFSVRSCLCLVISISAPCFGIFNGPTDYDVVIYGGTSAGVIAAAQVKKMGKTVVLIEPGNHLGGMMSNGLGWVDIKTPQAIGGLSAKYFNSLWKYYQRDSSWIWEKKHPIKGQLVSHHSTSPFMWVLEPHVGEKIFKAIIGQYKIPVVRNELLNRTNGVSMDQGRIVGISMESGLKLTGKMFIDATYEGDLMAAANVSYVIGREDNSLYSETFNGVQHNVPSSKKSTRIDCYLTKGSPESGLLPRIYPDTGEENGTRDNGVQSYNYRMCLTNVPENRILIEKPIGYNEADYEIVFRTLESALAPKSMFKFDLIPNRKTDSNNMGLVSTDYVGMSWNYPEADYESRKKIAFAHESWQRGLIWTLQNHPRVPEAVQATYAGWGLPKDEFIDNNHWPYSLYVRESRRLVAPFVITEHVALGNIAVRDSIGLASYDMDSHAIKYVANASGFLEAEGGLFKNIPKPYQISYQSITPDRNECENLLIPVCLSASHSVYGSVRMEPTFMVLGQSAATAACLSIDTGEAIQDLSYELLRKQLLIDGQKLD